MRFQIKALVSFFSALLLFSVAAAYGERLEGDLGKRKMYLEQLLELVRTDLPQRGAVSPLDATWRDWLLRTGELPPDFGAMPSLPFLPDPLVLDEGRTGVPITTLSQWEEKRRWMEREIQYWFTGTFPPKPEEIHARVLSTRMDGEVRVEMIELRFGPEERAKLTMELLIPPGEGARPVFMTQWNHRGWALIAVRRGYIGCVYAGADSKDDTEGYAEIWYPQYDFTRLMRRAWGASRAIDYLYTRKEVDQEKIALTGHSRNGKQSLMAAAFDQRITAVIPSSGGTGAEDPFRYTSDKYDNETIADITRNFPHWLHPRMRFFIGREHKLPFDQNLLMALVAPRGLMLSSAITELQGNPWGIEQAYLSARKVYGFLGVQEKLAIRFRHGRHGTSARDIESYVDFFDSVFGRGDITPPRKLYYDYSFEKWKTLSKERIDPLDYPVKQGSDLLRDKGGREIKSILSWDSHKKAIQEMIQWGLGDEPAGITNEGLRKFWDYRSRGDDYLGKVIGRPEGSGKMRSTVIGPYSSFGDYLYGHLYYPVDAAKDKTKKLPVVLFLHEYDYSSGFARRSQSFIEGLVGRGYAVFTFDMIGFGSRIEEGTHFYQRYPHWSKLGKMVADVRAAVTVMEHLDLIDAERIYTFGYALGGTVGMVAAALDDRIAGVGSVCGFTPLRTAKVEQGIEGVRAYSHLHGLMPRLGFFVEREERIPFDFDEILAACAPRPLMIVAPRLDRDAVFEDVRSCVDRVKGVYGLYEADERVVFEGPMEFNRFTLDIQREVLDWFAAMSDKTP